MAKLITIELLVFWEIFFTEHLNKGYKHKIYVGSAVLLRLSDLAALCIEAVPKYRLHCSLPSSAQMSRKGLLLDICMSGSGTDNGGFGVVMMSNGKNAVVEKKTWRNKEAIFHFVIYTVHNTWAIE
jgi:hypothetical protein